MNSSVKYWDNCYNSKNTGWDIGYVSTPLKDYFDQLRNKEIKILIPGAGKAWEAEYLLHEKFKNVTILDFSRRAIEEFANRCPEFPESQLVCEDFFQHTGRYDLIIEQTFFSSLSPSRRSEYVESIHSMLVPEGKLVGLLFNHEFSFEGPPFGGTQEEYLDLFSNLFDILQFDTAYNSIKPRMGRELFIVFKKK